MGKPFISVIIPVFNGARDLVRCLSALHAQSYPSDRFEVLVVDNGSTDNTVEAASVHPFVKVLKELSYESEPPEAATSPSKLLQGGAQGGQNGVVNQ